MNETIRFLCDGMGRKHTVICRWDEDEALAFLLRGLEKAGCSATRRQITEKLLPILGKSVSAPEESYAQLVLALLERAALATELPQRESVTEPELAELLEKEKALPGLFAAAVREYQKKYVLTSTPAERALYTGQWREGDRLRVCLMNDSFPPVVDGVANAVVNYARILTETEGGCAVATPEYPGAEDDYPFPVVRYPSLDTTRLAGYRAGVPFAPSALATLTQMNFQVIHSHCPVVSTLLARSLRDNIHAPVVFTYHTKFDIDINKAVKGELMQEAAIRMLVGNIASCDEVWVVSAGAGDNLRSLGYRGDYVVMPNGVDLARGRAPRRAVEELSEKWALPEGVPVYLFVGRIMWYKGLHILLDGLARVKAAGKDFRMVFVGDGMDRKEVEAEAEALGLTERCRFVGAERDREVIRAWYSRAELLLFPSTFDTNGLVVREAAACDLATLLIEGSCASEGIEHGRTGLLVPETGEGIAAALLSPDAAPERLREIGETAGREIYISWEDSVERAREQYRSVLRRWNSGELHRKRMPIDALFDLNGEMGELLADARARRQESMTQLLRSLDKARERVERYM